MIGMKKVFFLFLLMFFYSFSFSQNEITDKFITKAWDLDFKGCVKKITLKNFRFQTKNNKNDTVVTLSEYYYTKKGQLFQEKTYNKSLNDVTQIIVYNAINKVEAIYRKRNDTMSLVLEQYYRPTFLFPDSTYIYRPEYSQIEKYVNHFNERLLVKQDHFINNKLIDYRNYKYDKRNRLTEDLYINSENESGERLKTSESRGGYTISFYPQRQTLYEYRQFKDTLITTQILPGKTIFKEVKKEVKKAKFSLEILEKHVGSYNESSRFIYKSKDTISDITYYYKNNKEVSRFYKTTTTPKEIVFVSKSDFYSDGKERISVTLIKTDYDNHKNWIKKTYSEGDKISAIIVRVINDYCY